EAVDATGSSSSAHGSSSSGTGASGSSTAAADSSSSSGETMLPECPSYAAGIAAATISDPELEEISGIAASRMYDGVSWVHNDSGDGPRVFAVGVLGATLAELEIAGAFALDWEDMALGPGPEPGVDYLYFGDVGDNPELRANVTVYRVPEPDPNLGSGTLDGAEALTLDYADGSHNAETLLVDPTTGDLAIVTKSERGSTVWWAAAPLEVGGTIQLEAIAELPFGSAALPGSPLATGGDIAPDGSLIVVRTLDAVFGWRRSADASLADAFATEPCALPMVDEEQGEALAVLDGAYLTVSEGEMSTVWRFEKI
ncbi:MAG: hypothetical protein IAG13_39200, partial [Deltaproteobacteria bacterium]|nr:hypothetical protein [Nannocystaceae bacterium]